MHKKLILYVIYSVLFFAITSSYVCKLHSFKLSNSLIELPTGPCCESEYEKDELSFSDFALADFVTTIHLPMKSEQMDYQPNITLPETPAVPAPPPKY